MTPTDPKGVKFLDGIKLECPDNRFINSFQFEQRTSEFRYKYECLEAPSADEGFEIETYSNNWSDWGPWADHVDKTYGNVNFLDRQTVDCFGQGFLMSFEVETNLANGQLRYIYSCGRPIGTYQICESIQNRQTVKTDAEKYLFPSLRHHNVKCQENELISKFRLLPDYDFPGHIWYEYSCCQVSSQSDTDVSEATEWLTMIPKDTKGIRFLDQAKLQCPAQKFINAFQFEERSNKFRYKYTCQEGPLDHDGIEIETITNFWSDWGPWADHIDKTWGNVNFLDRQTVDCSNKGYLTSLRAETNLQRGQFRYIYDCGKLHGIKSRCQECKVRKTETLDSETFLLPTLRHHDVRCETNEVIKKFRLLVDYESPRGHVYYQYTCCNPNKYC